MIDKNINLKAVLARPSRFFRQHCQYIDNLCIQIWTKNSLTGCCLLAVGGYGRGELYPHSDLDILLIVPSDNQALLARKESIAQLLRQLWDLGLTIAPSVRSVEDCLNYANIDISVHTSLLETRRIAGDMNLYREFLRAIKVQMNFRKFFAAKCAEQTVRHAKFDTTSYRLEPNLKESVGGLRDVHLMQWLLHAQQLEQPTITQGSKYPNSWHDSLVQTVLFKQILNSQDLIRLQRYTRHLTRLRIGLHFLSGRNENRLLFDYQTTLAQILGYRDTPQLASSEQLMRDYYRSVRNLSLFNERLINSLTQSLDPYQPKRRINARFSCQQGWLVANHPQVFAQDTVLLEPFLLLAQHPEWRGLGVDIVDALQQALPRINASFRRNPLHQQQFLRLLMLEDGMSRGLRAMHRYGVLGRYIPALGRVIGQMQHDLFHVYTVDEHTLNVLHNLQDFISIPQQFPLCSKLFAKFANKHLLYLAALFHDLAKGRGGDHSTLGALEAGKFCRLHRLDPVDTKLVVWLVQSHLLMSMTAQKADIDDVAVIRDFAKTVGNERYLTALYLLTVADIRATSPRVWNSWKAQLLESLFVATRDILLQQPSTPDARARKHSATSQLVKTGVDANVLEAWWASLGDDYFARHTIKEIVWHGQLACQSPLTTQQTVIRARLSSQHHGVMVLIYTPDCHDLFARICYGFERLNLSVVSAKIYTTCPHLGVPYALNTFIVLERTPSNNLDALPDFILQKLQCHLESPPDKPTPSKLHGQAKYMPIATTVRMQKQDPHCLIHITTNDRPNLLVSIAKQFLMLNVNLVNAKINTLGARAEDAFIITRCDGTAWEDGQLVELVDTLRRNI